MLLHLSAFNDSREGVRTFAARRIATYGTEAAPLMIELLGEDEGYTRECAALALREMGRVAIPFLKRAMRNPNEAIRQRAAIILVAIGEEPEPDTQGQMTPDTSVSAS
jgi:HEAT repeat protein